MSFLIAGLQLKSIFIQKELPALVILDSYLKFLTTTFLTLKKRIIIINVDQIYIVNLMTQLLHQDFCISGCDDKVYKVLSVEKNH